MRRLEITCDGCDLTEEVIVPIGGEADFGFDGWVAHHVVVRENGDPTYENVVDLCPTCAEKMRHAINPANWPKLDPEVKRFVKKATAR
jgi:hypothetical protein